MADPKVADLTIGEFKTLVRESVAESIAELLGDPDEGLSLRDGFAEELKQSLSEVRDGGETTSLSQFLREP
jgi:hypothetical protein